MALVCSQHALLFAVQMSRSLRLPLVEEPRERSGLNPPEASGDGSTVLTSEPARDHKPHSQEAPLQDPVQGGFGEGGSRVQASKNSVINFIQ